MKKIYLVEDLFNAGYDEYDSFVCAANNEKEALLMADDLEGMSAENSKITLIGVTDIYSENSFILKSFNAG